MGKLFGTDGIRGVANRYPMTAMMALKTGRAVASFVKDQGLCAIVIGKDTRLSCDMLETALCAGITSRGVDALIAGVIPTPGVAFLASSIENAGAGIVISASHNPYQDNGIKIFKGDGCKLLDSEEEKIEEELLNNRHGRSMVTASATTKNESHLLPNSWKDFHINRHGRSMVTASATTKNESHLLPNSWKDFHINKKDNSVDDIGRIYYLTDALERYALFLKSSFVPEKDFSKLKIVIDCSNGASFKVAPMIFSNPWFESEFIFNHPDGKNINDQCGSQHTEKLSKMVLEKKADLGLAFDGDADRLIAVDEKGDKLTGDMILAICAKHAKAAGKLKNNQVVATVMSNIGFLKALESLGIECFITDVGDRKVLEKMSETGAVMGGEDSGHMIFSEYHTTGDGILTALRLLFVMTDTEKKLSELALVMKVYPQVLMNVEVDESKPDFMKIKPIADEIKSVEKELSQNGRVLVRYSGTQPLLRVMVEGPDEKKTMEYCSKICDKIRIFGRKEF
ncbi:MAG: phosphoglucosamine mutase [Thermodesulfobacteriota bacterium]|nr:phosphoglucosamine mutase [Thermodesulfobacteriota bacterium]